MTQEVLKLALEFLEDNQDLIEVYERPEYLAMYKAAIDKCKEALAQEQWGASAVTHPEYVAEQKRKTEELRSKLEQPVAQTQEPTVDVRILQAVSDEYNAWIRAHASGMGYDDFLIQRLATRSTKARLEQFDTASPMREWVFLTRDDHFEVLAKLDPQTKRLPLEFAMFAKAIEEKSREKNFKGAA